MVEQFKRTHAEFSGADVPLQYHMLNSRTAWVPAQRVKIIRICDEDEDVWTVETATGGVYDVNGDELNPHPRATPTNIEFLTHFMEHTEMGSMGQTFVIEAVAKYAAMVINMPQASRDSMDATMLPYAPWAASAKEALDYINARRL
jgi:hypothetical protein